MNKKRMWYWSFAGILAILIGYGCVHANGRYDRPSLSQGATEEIARLAKQAGVGPPQIVLAIDAGGRFAPLPASGFQLETIKFPQPAKQIDSVSPVTFLSFSNSPGTPVVCPDPIGGYSTCVRPRPH
jgi:hypothetical protein